MLRYAISDRRRMAGDEQARREALLAQAARLRAMGVEFLQLREKDLSARAVVELARELMSVLRGGGVEAGERRTRLLVNSRVDVAVAAGADGVHLTSAAGELRPGQVRRVFAAAGRARAVVSVSCHGVEEVRRAVLGAVEDRPDVILFGPVFEKVVAGEGGGEQRVRDGLGLARLREACVAAGGVPVLALGGVDAGNAEACVAAGAAGVAAIRMFAGELR